MIEPGRLPGMAVVATIAFILAGVALPHEATCLRLEHADLWGPEDLALDTQSSDRPRLLISAEDRRWRSPNSREPHRSGIHWIDLGPEPDRRPRRFSLRGRGKCSFHPHGISLTRSDRGEVLLYVINHHDAADRRTGSPCSPWRDGMAREYQRHSIEVFEVGRAHLKMRERLTSLLLISPNDLFARPNGDLYVTNYPDNVLSGAVEFLLTSMVSNVVRYHSGDWEPVADGFRYANGIAVGLGGERLYVAASVDRRIFPFQVLKKTNGTPEFLRLPPLDLESGFDNLSWSPDGESLIVAAHTDLRQFGRHAASWQKGRREKSSSPSIVCRVPVETGDARRATRLYSSEAIREANPDDTESLISGASSAVCHGSDLYIGQVFENFVLYCPGACSSGAAESAECPGIIAEPR